nr:RNA-directed DNA polymerase, eukaryota, reverse transcriptase zinc-binding domain protein [Tanacetum cinerariifolium]
MKNIEDASKLSHEGLEFSFRRNPRGGVEQAQFERLKEMVEGVTLSNSNDRWSWSLVGSDDFSVSSFRKLIDNDILPKGISKTRWIKEAPGETEACLRRHMLYSLVVYMESAQLKDIWSRRSFNVNVYGEVIYHSFYWIRFRCKAKFSFIDWLKNPNLVLFWFCFAVFEFLGMEMKMKNKMRDDAYDQTAVMAQVAARCQVP